MKSGSGWKWLGIVFLAVSCTWMLAACSGDDDDVADGGGVTVPTETGDGSDDGAGDGDDGGGDDVGAPAADEVALAAPRLVAPANGTEYRVVLVANAKHAVNFQWTAVPGAASYMFQTGAGLSARTLDPAKAVYIGVHGTALTQSFGYSDFSWAVQAIDANGHGGPISERFNLSIKPIAAVPAP